MKTTVVVPAGGKGRRFTSEGRKKQFASLGNVPVFIHTLMSLHHCPRVDDVILVVPAEDQRDVVALLPAYDLGKVSRVIAGGDKRQDSVWEGIKVIGTEVDVIVIHDAVRPFVTPSLLEETVSVAANVGAAIAAIPATDTVKLSRISHRVTCTLPRDEIYLAQTPQAFKRDVIVSAYMAAYRDGYYGTDDASLVERMGGEVAIVPGSPRNIKITTVEDLQLLEYFMTRCPVC